MVTSDETSAIAKAPRALPLLGHLVPFIRDPQAFLTSLPDYGDLVTIKLGPLDTTVICDPELTYQVFRDGRTFDKGGLLFDRAREVLGNGLVTCPYRDHKRLRLMSQPAFRATKLPAYAQVMQEQIAQVTKDWQDGQTVDVFEDMLKIAAGTTIGNLFSGALSADINDIIRDFSTVLRAVFWRMLTPPALDWFPTPGKLRYKRALSRIGSMVDSVIADYRTSGKDHGDLLSLLLATPGADGPSDGELADAVVTFFVGGTDTTAITMAWALHNLAEHPEIQERVYKEVDQVFAGGPVSFANLDKLVFTTQVVTETLRQYPPSWVLTRITTTDIELGRHFIRAGTRIVVSPYLIHHRADLYQNPECFDPDRWAGKQPPPAARHGLIPFGAGARKCMGDEFAVAEATLALATMIGRWHMESAPGSRVRPRRMALLFPRGLRLRLTDRRLLP